MGNDCVWVDLHIISYFWVGTVLVTSLLTKPSVWYKIGILWVNIMHVKVYAIFLGFWLQIHMNQIFQIYAKTRTPQDMDGTLTLIFAKSKTIWDILMKISALLQLRPISILTKFQGHSSKIGSATPVRIFTRFWREIQILGTYDLDFLYKAGFHRG